MLAPPRTTAEREQAARRYIAKGAAPRVELLILAVFGVCAGIGAWGLWMLFR